MRMERWGGWLGALALVGALVGCGGAGNGGDPNGETPPLTDTPEAPGVLDGGTEGGGDAGTGGGGGTGDGGTVSDGDGGPGGGDGGASTGGQLGWGRENGYVGNAWSFKAMEGARDGSFAVWTFCLTACERTGETPRSRVDKLQGFRADGTPAWSMDFPRAMNVLSVEVSPSGRVIVGASYDKPADVAGTRVPAVEPEGGGNLYVLVLSPEGKHLWSRGFKAEHRPLTINRDPLWQLRVAADDADNVVLAGRWTGTLDLGGGALGSMADPDSFLFAARLDARGQHLWSRSLKGDTDGIHSVQAFGTDTGGNLVLGGTAEAPDSGKYDHLWNTEGGEPYALSLSAGDGSMRWRQVLRGTRGALTAVARTPEGGLAFAGSYLERGFTFAGESLPEPRGIDALLLAVTAGGEPRWARTFRGSSKEEQPRLVSDDLGHLTLGVVTDGTLDLGGEVFVPRPRKEPRGELYLARYDEEGHHVWSRLVGNHTRFSSAFFAYGIVAQPDGSATYGVQMTRASPVVVDGRTFNVEPDTAQLFLQFRH